MSTKIYKYPETSVEWEHKEQTQRLNNCVYQTDGYHKLDKDGVINIKKKKDKSEEKGIHLINNIDDNLDKTFKLTPQNLYHKKDAKLRDVIRNDFIHLDKPPYSSNYTASEVFMNENIDSYGLYYTGYEDIKGTVQYYVNKERTNPHDKNIFDIDAEYTHNVYKDPMGVYKSEYIREPSIKSSGCAKNNDYYGNLSSIHDTTLHREDIIASQTRKMNRESWVLRWKS